MNLVVHIPYQADEESSRALNLASNCKTSLSRSLGGSVGGLSGTTLARIIHDGSSRNRGVAQRERRANPRLQQNRS